MSDARDELLDHEYDGIREYDNPLPRWWLYLFYGCIVFAVVYVPYYHFGPGPLPHDEYAAEMEEAARNAPAVAALDPEALKALVEDPQRVAAGKDLYNRNCVACHGPDGGGLVGPNLTDNHWIHGDGSMVGLVKVISDGVPEKGMIAWKAAMKQGEIESVAAFVATLQGTTPANPKAPEGRQVATN